MIAPIWPRVFESNQVPATRRYNEINSA